MGAYLRFLEARRQTDQSLPVRPKVPICGMKDQGKAKPEEEEDRPDTPGVESSTRGLSAGKAAEGEHEPDQGAHSDEEGRAQEGEEGRTAAKPRTAPRVSQKEREEHELTHTPFRAWCRHCVRGRARNTSHKAKEAEEEQALVKRVSMDNFFISKQDEEAKDKPVIVMLDEETGEKYARATGRKGTGTAGEMDWLIKDMSAELIAWGHTGGADSTLVMKSDGEPAVQALRDAVGRFHGGRVVPESPAKGESQSNGAVEGAGSTVREFARVIKDVSEDKANISLDSWDIITQWIVRWAAMSVSRYMVGKDGRTAYERRRGRRCNVPSVPLGEIVSHKQIREHKEAKNKFDPELHEGVWLGHVRMTNETIIGTKEGVVRAYATIRKEEGARWTGEMIKQMQSTPRQPDPNKLGNRIPIHVRFDPASEEVEAPSQPLRKEGGRRMKTTQSLFKKYQHTEG